MSKADKLNNLYRQCLEVLEEINEQECPVVHRQLRYATKQIRLAAFDMEYVESESAKHKEDCTVSDP